MFVIQVLSTQEKRDESLSGILGEEISLSSDDTSLRFLGKHHTIKSLLGAIKYKTRFGATRSAALISRRATSNKSTRYSVYQKFEDKDFAIRELRDVDFDQMAKMEIMHSVEKVQNKIESVIRKKGYSDKKFADQIKALESQKDNLLKNILTCSKI